MISMMRQEEKTMIPSTFTPLDGGWTLRALNPEAIPDARVRQALSQGIATKVPGEATVALLDAGLIDDPFDGANEPRQQWIGDVDWRYSLTFTPTADQLAQKRQDLVAYGIDTVASIRLNGREVGHTDDYYLTYRFDARPFLHAGANTLEIDISSPVRISDEREQKNGFYPHTEHHAFNQIRKPSSQFGWDWGIDIANAGIWRPIGLDCWSGARIDAVRPLVSFESDGAAVVDVATAIEREGTGHALTMDTVFARQDPVNVRIVLRDPDGSEVASGTAAVTRGRREAHTFLRVPQPKRWWPIGYGDQPLYDLRVELPDSGAVWEQRIGLRSVSVNTSADENGRAFQLIINGMPIHARGYNWIPGDALLTRFDTKRYERAFDDLVESHSNMVRVWGGGIYESDDFYRFADEKGIMVWQDFMLACAAYPEDPHTVADITLEAEQQITRLSSHPSLVVWNGSNENYVAHADWWGYQRALRDDDLPKNSRGYSEKGWGDLYYSKIIPQTLARLDPTRVYLPSSPMALSDQTDANGDSNGTMHIWDVWNQKDYRHYADYSPRFADEFGYQAPPAWSTLTRVVHDKPLRLQSPQMLAHQKASNGQIKLARGMRGHLTPGHTDDVATNPDGFHSFVLPSDTWKNPQDWHWATQLQQAQAVAFGIRHMRSLEPVNAGCLVWQLDDDWPVVSWASVDYDGHRKPLWYATQQVFAPRFALIRPDVSDENRQANTFEGSGALTPDELVLVVLNDTRTAWTGTWHVERQKLDGTVLASANIACDSKPGQSRRFVLPKKVATFADPSTEVIVATADGYQRVVYHPSEVIDENLAKPAQAFTAQCTKNDATHYTLTVAAHSLVRDLFCMVDKVDSNARISGGLDTLLNGESISYRIVTSRAVDPQAFCSPDVLRSANDLKR